MRKTKQIKRKEVIYSIEEWEEIKRLAETASLKTGTYIKRISLNGKINVIDLNEVTPVMNALRIIGNNINQIAKKANEINSIYASDIENLKENYEDICHTLNLFLSTLPSTEHSLHIKSRKDGRYGLYYRPELYGKC